MVDFLKELTRRKVWLFGGIYLALGWILLQVAVVVETTLSLPTWVDQIALVLLTLGFPVALLLAWAQESRVDFQGSQEDAAKSVEATLRKTAENRSSFSLAVLPFDDLSPDGAFSESGDAISEDALTQLSSFANFNVAARNSSFAFKGTSVDIRDVGEKLGVRFVLEGSLRSLGDKVRITAQLIETLSGDHVWSRNFDLPRSEIETGLDGVVETLAGGVSSVMISNETTRLERLTIDELSIDELGSLALYRTSDESHVRLLEGETYLDAALKMSPGHSGSLALMARIQVALALWAPEDQDGRRRRAEAYLEQARAAGRPDFRTLISLGTAAAMMGQQSMAEAITEQMREMAPGHPATWGITTFAHFVAGRYSEALQTVRKAKSLTSIQGPFYAAFQAREGLAHFGLGDYAQAEVWARKALSTTDRTDARLVLTASLAHQGHLEEAKTELAVLRPVWPGPLTLNSVYKISMFGLHKDEIVEQFREGLRLAGVEEGKRDA